MVLLILVLVLWLFNVKCLEFVFVIKGIKWGFNGNKYFMNKIVYCFCES